MRAAWLTAEITARPAGARGGALPDVAGGAVQLVAGTVALVQDELALVWVKILDPIEGDIG